MSANLFPLLNWKSFQPIVMSNRAALVRDGLNDFPLVFPASPFTATQMNTKKTTLDSTYALRGNGINAKNNFDAACTDMNLSLRSVAGYVKKVADGDKTIINQGGFDNSAEAVIRHTVVPEIGSTAGIKVRTGGYMDVAIPAVVGADDYTILIFMGPVCTVNLNKDYVTIPQNSPVDVLVIPNSGVLKHLTGLTAGQEYNIVIIGHNPIGLGAMGPAVHGFTI